MNIEAQWTSRSG